MVKIQYLIVYLCCSSIAVYCADNTLSAEQLDQIVEQKVQACIDQAKPGFLSSTLGSLGSWCAEPFLIATQATIVVFVGAILVTKCLKIPTPLDLKREGNNYKKKTEVRIQQHNQKTQEVKGVVQQYISGISDDLDTFQHLLFTNYKDKKIKLINLSRQTSEIIKRLQQHGDHLNQLETELAQLNNKVENQRGLCADLETRMKNIFADPNRHHPSFSSDGSVPRIQYNDLD